MSMNRLVVIVSCVLLATIAVGHSVAAKEVVVVTIHTEQKNASINPFIYGQFIEHLGRCVYGGIWAEMLEDRKFFFPITKDYAPYTSLTDTRLPVVGASPWEILGDPAGVSMAKGGSFVGEHTPRIAPGGGIRHRDLGVVQGKQYTGHIWLKAVGGRAGPVEVTLVWGDGDAQRQTHAIQTVTAEYQKYPFRFTAGTGTDAAMLEIRVTGKQAMLVGTVSLMPADHAGGMRRDTLALLRQLGASMYRWPGGNFVSGYDWRDGTGPRDRRPPRRNPAWSGVEHNDFGLDEFLDFCRRLRAEPLITVNTGFGDAYSAAQEVEYCNASTETIGGSWRAKHGHPEPYCVRYWCVGNEMHGSWQLGFMQLRHYTRKHNRVARAMRNVDPTIRLIGVGCLNHKNSKYDPKEKRGWSRGMLEECSDTMDYVSEHFYIYETKTDTTAHVAQMVNAIRARAEGHRKLQAGLPKLHGRTIPITIDEWNYWYQPYQYGELGCVYRLRDALGVAAGLHECFRNSDIIQMAHYAQTVNVIGCIKTTKTDAIFSTTALPLMLYRRHFGVTPVTISGSAETTALDIAAALTADGRALTIGAVNPSGKQKVVHLEIKGAEPENHARLWRIAGDDPAAFNSPEKQPITIDGPHNVAFEGTVKLPPQSVSLYRLPLK